MPLTKVGELVDTIGSQEFISIYKGAGSPALFAEKILLLSRGEFQMGSLDKDSIKKLILENKNNKEIKGTIDYTVIQNIYPVRIARTHASNPQCPLFDTLVNKGRPLGYTLVNIPLKDYVGIDPLAQQMITTNVLNVINKGAKEKITPLLNEIEKFYTQQDEEKCVAAVKKLETSIDGIIDEISKTVKEICLGEIKKLISLEADTRKMQAKLVGKVILDVAGTTAAVVGAVAGGPGVGMVLGFWAFAKGLVNLADTVRTCLKEWDEYYETAKKKWLAFRKDYADMINSAKIECPEWNRADKTKEAVALLSTFITGADFFKTGVTAMGDILNHLKRKTNKALIEKRNLARQLDTLLRKNENAMKALNNPAMVEGLPADLVQALKKNLESAEEKVNGLILAIQDSGMLLQEVIDFLQVEKFIAEMQSKKPFLIKTLDYGLFAADLALNFNNWAAGTSMADYGKVQATTAGEVARIATWAGGGAASTNKVLGEFGLVGTG